MNGLRSLRPRLVRLALSFFGGHGSVLGAITCGADGDAGAAGGGGVTAMPCAASRFRRS